MALVRIVGWDQRTFTPKPRNRLFLAAVLSSKRAFHMLVAYRLFGESAMA